MEEGTGLPRSNRSQRLTDPHFSPGKEILSLTIKGTVRSGRDKQGTTSLVIPLNFNHYFRLTLTFKEVPKIKLAPIYHPGNSFCLLCGSQPKTLDPIEIPVRTTTLRSHYSSGSELRHRIPFDPVKSITDSSYFPTRLVSH